VDDVKGLIAPMWIQKPTPDHLQSVSRARADAAEIEMLLDAGIDPTGLAEVSDESA
jgi:hypothetical protein